MFFTFGKILRSKHIHPTDVNDSYLKDNQSE